MSSEPESNRESEREFLERILRYQEKSISPEELRLLNQDLRNSPQRLAEFNRICETSRLIHEVTVAPAGNKATKPKSRILPLFTQQTWAKYAGLAAILMLCLGLGMIFGLRDRETNAWGDAVAKLEYCSEDAAFSDFHEMPNEAGDLLGQGWLYLERGQVRILFRSGASVELIGSTAFGVDSPMRAYLEYGKASVYAPDSARDFVVATEAMEVVDLGTRFDVQVDPESQESMVAVTEGLVDLHLGSRGTQRRIQPLEAGWQAQVDDSGEIVNLEKSPGQPLPVAESPTESPLMAHWRLDQTEPNGTLKDSSNREINAIFHPGTESGHRPGVDGQALRFGTNGYIDISEHLALLTQLDAFTFSAWIRDPGKKVNILFSLSDGTASNRVQLNLSTRNLTYLWQHQSPHWDSILGRVDGWKANQWYHVAVSVTSEGARLYRDGQLIGSGSAGVKIGTPFQTLIDVEKPTQAYIGYITQGTAGPRLRPQKFSGVMDDVQFYTTALDSTAIRYLHEHPGEAWSPDVAQ